MSIPPVQLLGYVAAALTTASFFPQALKTLRTRDTAGISLGMYLMFTAGVAVWAIFGLLTRNGPVLVSNLITVLPAGLVLQRKIANIRR
jgi:MtN3 and saliva related transmembrane protein